MEGQLERKNSGPTRALVALLAFVTNLVGSIVLFLGAWGGGTEDDTGEWAWIASGIAAVGLVVALGVNRLGLRSVAWSIVAASTLALIFNLAFGWGVENLPSE